MHKNRDASLPLPAALMGVIWRISVRIVVVVVLVRKFNFITGGEVAAATRILAGRGRDLDQISVATDQETGPVEMNYQTEGVVEPLDEPSASESLSAKNEQCSFARTEEIRPAMA
jgi:hypothetical protein